jgi:DeoR family fructose operon transcriptional repressor
MGALSLMEPALGERHGTRSEQKRKIAAAAVDLLPDVDGNVLLDGGSTTAALADLLPAERRLLVATNSVPIAARLSAVPGVALHVLGGRVRCVTQTAVGESTVRALEHLRLDVAFLGANGITARHGFSTPDETEAATKQAMARAAQRVVVLGDSSKLGREHLVRFAAVDDVDVLVTDSDADAETLEALRSAGIEVVVA